MSPSHALLLVPMEDDPALVRAAERVRKMRARIEAQKASIKRFPPGSARRQAEEVLRTYEQTQRLFEQHYISLGGKLPE